MKQQPTFLRSIFLLKTCITLLDCNYVYAASDIVLWEHSLKSRPSCTAWVTFSLQMAMLFAAHWIMLGPKPSSECPLNLLWYPSEPWKRHHFFATFQLEVPKITQRTLENPTGWRHVDGRHCVLRYGVGRRSCGFQVCWGSAGASAEQGDSDLVQILTLRDRYWNKGLPELDHRGKIDQFVPNRNLREN